MLIVGEVQTGFLQNSVALSHAAAGETLAILAGERVRHSERPIQYAISPELLTGVDCRLATATGSLVHGIGTAATRATLTGGHVLQGSAFARLVRTEHDGRLPWPHYLARPGVVEMAGKIDGADLAGGFVAAESSRRCLELGAIADRLMSTVQRSPGLDRAPPFRTARTRLRWVVQLTDRSPADAAVQFSIANGTLRTLRMVVALEQPAAAVEFCEDVALHDWLLTTLLTLIERSRIGAGPRSQVVDRLRPAIDYLIHLWMPATRVDRSLSIIWQGLEQRPGFSRQWEVLVNRIRDQLTSNVIALLHAAGQQQKPAATGRAQPEPGFGGGEHALGSAV